MLSGVCLGANNLDAATVFYDKVLGTIGMKRMLSEPNERGYAGPDGRVVLFLLKPFDGRPATFGNGTQIMFYARDANSVDAFYRTAIQCGGRDEGAPGPRDYHPEYYGAYVRDLDGNKLNISVEIPREVLKPLHV